MHSQIVGLRTAGVVFAVMCLAQVLRLATRLDVLVAGHHVPLWPSAIATVVLAALSFWMWKLAWK